MARVKFKTEADGRERGMVGALIVRMGLGSITDKNDPSGNTTIIFLGSWGAKYGHVKEAALNKEQTRRIAEMPGMFSVNPEIIENLVWI